MPAFTIMSYTPVVVTVGMLVVVVTVIVVNVASGRTPYVVASTQGIGPLKRLLLVHVLSAERETPPIVEKLQSVLFPTTLFTQVAFTLPVELKLIIGCPCKADPLLCTF